MDENIKKDDQSSDSIQNEKKEEEKPQNELEECQKKCDEYLNNWKRTTADLINYKKEELERIGFLAKYAREDMILKMLPVIDSFYLAEKQLPEKLKAGIEGTPQSIEWTKGFMQIQKQIEEFLKKEGIEEVKVLGEKFNPNTMEVVEETSNTQNLTPDTVMEELQKGYKINDKVLRPAKVKISK